MRALDSFAWIEYFKGSKRGGKVRECVDGVEPLYTPSICLTEIKSKYLKEGRDPTERIKFIMERSLIIPIDGEIALLAAEIKQKHGLHTVDAVIYAAAKQRKLTLVTGDKHFEKLPGIEMI